MITILRESDLKPDNLDVPIEKVELSHFSYFSNPDETWMAQSETILFIKEDELIKIFKHRGDFPNHIDLISNLLKFI